MQVRPSSGPGGCWIGHHGRSAVGVRAGGHPQQLALGGPLATPDARPDRTRRNRWRQGHRCASHWPQPYRAGRLFPEPGVRRRSRRALRTASVPACRPSWTTSTATVSTRRSGIPTTCRPGAPRAETACLSRRRGRSPASQDPAGPGVVVPGPAPRAPARLGHRVGGSLRAGRQHGRRPALREGADGARGAASARGLAAAEGRGRGPRPDGGLPALDGRGVAERLRGDARAVGRDLPGGGVREVGRPRGARRRWAWA